MAYFWFNALKLWRSNRKSASPIQKIGSPPYFYFRFGLYSPRDGTFCRFLPRITLVLFILPLMPLLSIFSFHSFSLLISSSSVSAMTAKSSAYLPFWYWLTWVVLEKGPLNMCVCVCVCVCVCARARVRVCILTCPWV